MADRDERAPVQDRETVVVDRDDRGPGGLVALIVGIIIVFLIGWMIFAILTPTDDGTETDTGVNGEVDVDVNLPEGDEQAPETETETETEN